MTSININSRLNLDVPIVDQVIQALSVPGLRLRRTESAGWLNGQPVAAIVAASLLEGIGNVNGFHLPTIVIHGGGAEVNVEKGVFDLNNWRHNIVRPKRTMEIDEHSQKRVIILDGMGFGLAPEILKNLATTLDVESGDIEVFNVKLGQADYTHPEVGVLGKLIELPSYVWAQDTHLILLPEGWAPRAVITATACYGLQHTWPDVLRLSLRPDKGVDYKELVGVQELRQRGAQLVTQWEENKTLEAIMTATHAISDILRNEGNILYMKLPDNRELKLVVTAAEIV